MARVFVSGSITYDTLLRVDADFRDAMAVSAESLSVGYHCAAMHRTFGGCAANIAFHLKRIGVDASIIAAVGYDFTPYADWLEENGVDQSMLHRVPDKPTAQVFIITDSQQNQILVLHPGAMHHSRDIRLPNPRVDLAIVGPDDRDSLMMRITEFDGVRSPVFLDPGQSITSLSNADLKSAIGVARWMIVNEHECSQVISRLGVSVDSLANQLDALVVTLGSQGSLIYTEGRECHVQAISVADAVDPTGCGDTFRAGLIAGLLAGDTLVAAAQRGSAMAGETLRYVGAQWQVLPE